LERVEMPRAGICQNSPSMLILLVMVEEGQYWV
jgi:hypothetical protein